MPTVYFDTKINSISGIGRHSGILGTDKVGDFVIEGVSVPLQLTGGHTSIGLNVSVDTYSAIGGGSGILGTDEFGEFVFGGVSALTLTVTHSLVHDLQVTIVAESISGYTDKIINGGFETSDFTGWLINTSWSVSPLWHYEGAFCAVGSGTDPLSQDIDLTDVHFLSWKDYSIGGWAGYTVYIDANMVHSGVTTPGAWVSRSIDVSGYTGIHTLSFIRSALPGAIVMIDGVSAYTARATLSIKHPLSATINAVSTISPLTNAISLLEVVVNPTSITMPSGIIGIDAFGNFVFGGSGRLFVWRGMAALIPTVSATTATIYNSAALQAVISPESISGYTEKIINGGFEAGSFTGWSSYTNWSVSGLWHNTGSFCATTNGTDPLSQIVDLTDVPFLSWSDYSIGGWAGYKVYIDAAEVYSGVTTTGAWISRNINTSAYTGIHIVSFVRSLWPGAFVMIDDVSAYTTPVTLSATYALATDINEASSTITLVFQALPFYYYPDTRIYNTSETQATLSVKWECITEIDSISAVPASIGQTYSISQTIDALSETIISAGQKTAIFTVIDPVSETVTILTKGIPLNTIIDALSNTTTTLTRYISINTIINILSTTDILLGNTPLILVIINPESTFSSIGHQTFLLEGEICALSGTETILDKYHIIRKGKLSTQCRRKTKPYTTNRKAVVWVDR